MPAFIDVRGIIEADQRNRPQRNHAELSAQLCELVEDRATQLTLSHLATSGTGNPKLAESRRPLMAQLVRKAVDDLSVVYSVPATRRLREPGGELLPDGSIGAALLREAFDLAQYDQAWRAIDQARTSPIVRIPWANVAQYVEAP